MSGRDLRVIEAALPLVFAGFFHPLPICAKLWTTDERLRFLLQSTESLHSSLQDLTATVAELRRSVTDLTRVVEIDAENIRGLANIAAAHQARLDDVDNRLSG